MQTFLREKFINIFKKRILKKKRIYSIKNVLWTNEGANSSNRNIPQQKKINNTFNQIDTTVFYNDYLFIKCKQSVGNNLKVTR